MKENKKILIILIIIITIILISLIYRYGLGREDNAAENNLITVEEVLNTTYEISGRKLEFEDGSYSYSFYQGKGSQSNEPNAEAIVRMDKEKIFWGDLNGDEIRDVVVATYTNLGGTGIYVDLVVFLNEDGKPSFFDNIDLGDRAKIKSVDINNGNININLITHGPDDPMCCPTLETSKQYYLYQGQLVEKNVLDDKSDTHNDDLSDSVDVYKKMSDNDYIRDLILDFYSEGTDIYQEIRSDDWDSYHNKEYNYYISYPSIATTSLKINNNSNTHESQSLLIDLPIRNDGRIFLSITFPNNMGGPCGPTGKSEGMRSTNDVIQLNGRFVISSGFIIKSDIEPYTKYMNTCTEKYANYLISYGIEFSSEPSEEDIDLANELLIKMISSFYLDDGRFRG